jgi:putative tryptophan/tyrosine transport system substrate-binding protein
MRRREFVTFLGGAVALPFAASAQQPKKMARVGVALGTVETDPEGRKQVEAFRQGLQDLGWIDGQNVTFEYRPANNSERARVSSAELVALAPDVILAAGTVALTALQQATRSIPIVFVNVTDPVAGGFVKSLAQPGGNITGFTPFEYPIAGKWLEQLKEIAPRISRVALLGDPNNHNYAGFSRPFEIAAASLSIEPIKSPVLDAAEIDLALSSLAAASGGGFIVTAAAYSVVHRDLLISLAAKYNLPAIYWARFFPANGGLVSYGPDTEQLYRQSAMYVDRVLKGDSPDKLPIQEATKFQTVLNLKTAMTLGLAPSPALLSRVDEVIE